MIHRHLNPTTLTLATIMDSRLRGNDKEVPITIQIAQYPPTKCGGHLRGAYPPAAPAGWALPAVPAHKAHR